MQYSYFGLVPSRDAFTPVEFDGRFGSLAGGLDEVTVDTQLPEPGSIALLGRAVDAGKWVASIAATPFVTAPGTSVHYSHARV